MKGAFALLFLCVILQWGEVYNLSYDHFHKTFGDHLRERTLFTGLLVDTVNKILNPFGIFTPAGSEAQSLSFNIGGNILGIGGSLSTSSSKASSVGGGPVSASSQAQFQGNGYSNSNAGSGGRFRRSNAHAQSLDDIDAYDISVEIVTYQPDDAGVVEVPASEMEYQQPLVGDVSYQPYGSGVSNSQAQSEAKSSSGSAGGSSYAKSSSGSAGGSSYAKSSSGSAGGISYAKSSAGSSAGGISYSKASSSASASSGAPVPLLF